MQDRQLDDWLLGWYFHTLTVTISILNTCLLLILFLLNFDFAFISYYTLSCWLFLFDLYIPTSFPLSNLRLDLLFIRIILLFFLLLVSLWFSGGLLLLFIRSVMVFVLTLALVCHSFIWSILLSIVIVSIYIVWNLTVYKLSRNDFIIVLIHHWN